MSKKIVFIILFLLSIPLLYISFTKGEIITTILNGTKEVNTTITAKTNETIYISVPKNATIISARLNISGLTNSTPNTYCYQESANKSTDCGGLDTGNYSNTDFFSDPSNAWDGDWYTFANIGDTKLGYIYINYTKPVGARPSSLWMTKLNVTSALIVLNFTNSTIPSGCWNYSDKLILRMSSDRTVGNNASGQCYDGYADKWVVLVNNSIYSLLYEEGMFWNITIFAENVTLNVGNDSDIEFNNSGPFNTKNKTNDFAVEINEFLSTCTPSNGNCSVPLVLYSDTSGIVEISDIEIIFMEDPNVSLSTPSDSSILTSSSVTFNCSANVLNDEDIYNVTLYHNISGSWELNESRTDYSGGSGFGNWTFVIDDGYYVWNCLFANNLSDGTYNNITTAFASSNYSFTLDTTYPVWDYNGSNVSNPKVSVDVLFYVNWSDSLGLSNYLFSWNDSGSWVNFSTVFSTNPENVTIAKTITATQGKHVGWLMFGNDSAGNINVTAEYVLIIDNTLPTFNESLSAQSVELGNSLSYDVNCSDVDGDSVSYSVNNTLVSIDSTTGVISDTPTYIDVGSWDLRVNCSDGVGNSSDTFTYTITDSNIPTFSNPVNGSVSFKKYSNFTANITISDSGGLNYSWLSHNNSVTGWANESPVAIEGLSAYRFNNSQNITLARGNYVCWKVYANDTENNVGTSSEYCFTVVNTLPTFNESLTAQTVEIGNNLVYNVNCSDVDVDTLSYSVNNSMVNIYSNNGSIYDTPTVGDIGAYDIKINCSDGVGNSSDTFAYTVQDTLLPRWSNPVNGSTNMRRFENFTANITIADNGALNFSIFSTNDSGSWVNSSPVSLNAVTSFRLNSSFNLTSVSGQNVCWRVYANDSVGNINESEVYCFDVADTPTTFSNAKNGSADFKVYSNFTANITITDNDKINYSWFSTNVTKTWVNDTPVPSNNVLSYNFNNMKNLTNGYPRNVCWQVWANDSVGAITNSSIYCFNMSNTVPTVASVQLNDSSFTTDQDLGCLNGSIRDMDNNSMTLFYDWNINEVWQDLNSVNLSSSLTSTDDIIYCKLLISDSYSNSSWITSDSVQIDSGNVAPIINWSNATTTKTGLNSTNLNPTNNDSWVNLSVTFDDVNAGENFTSFFCDTSNFNSTTLNCTDTTLCSSIVNQSSNYSSCRFDVAGITSQSMSYYVFVLDNSSLWSTSVEGVFYVNHPPARPSIITPNNTFFNTGWALLNFSSSDPDSDLINYSLFSNVSGTYTLQYNGTNKFFNYSSLSNTKYYYLVQARDHHGYNSTHNTSVYEFTIDTIVPNVTITSPNNGSTYSSTKVTLSKTVADTNLDSCFYEIVGSVVGSTNYTNASTINNCTTSEIIDLSAYADQNFTMRHYVNDSAGNINNTSPISFTIYTTPLIGPSTGGGGGGREAEVECVTDNDCKIKYGVITYLCSGGKCVLNETVLKVSECGDGICDYTLGEDVISCSQDCEFSLSYFTCDNPNEPCFWKSRWVTSFSLVLAAGIAFWLFYLDEEKKKKYKQKYKKFWRGR